MMGVEERWTRREWLGGGAALAGASFAPQAMAAAASPEWRRAEGIVRAIAAPALGAHVFDITRFGARPGIASGPAIAAAIAAAHAAGGGRVLVPAGRFTTSPIRLLSRVELHLADGATLAFSTDPRDYPIVPTSFEGVDCMNYAPLIGAWGQTDVAITGSGTLDGQASGASWWSWKGPWQGSVDHGWTTGKPNQIPARRRLFQMARDRVPLEQRVFGEGAYLRPAFIEPNACRRVLIEGVKLRGAPFWQVHPLRCTDVIVRGLDILGHGPNNDGCDPESCERVLIEDCTFDTGDDCIAIKSGRVRGAQPAMPTRAVVIRGCRMREGHGGITIGSEIAGGVSAVAERCRMDSPNLDFALRFKNNAQRGGVLEDIHVRDIEVGQVAQAAIQADFNYEEGANGPYRPVLRNVTVERLRAARATRALDLQGLPKAPIGEISLIDCSFAQVTRPDIVVGVDRLDLRNVAITGDKGGWPDMIDGVPS